MNDSYKKIVNLLKLFKNRPYHLGKFLIDNNAFNDEFMQRILNSKNLNDIDNIIMNFNSIEKMEEFYSSLLDLNFDNKTKEEAEEEVNDKLDKLIKEEKYEEAANLRDYMKRKKIRRR